MPILAVIFGVLAIVMGLIGLISPQTLAQLARGVLARGGFYWAAGARLFFGAAVYFAAGVSRSPLLVGIIGFVLILSGVAAPLVGEERAQRTLASWSSGGSSILRVFAGVALVIGVALTWALAF